MDKISTTRYNRAPTISKGRSRFDLSHLIRTTCNTGDFVVTNFEWVYPGETFSISNSNFIRLETSLHQTMDQAFLETAHFFVPLRIIWDDLDKFFGYNENPWARSTEVTMPQINLVSEVEPQSVLNHLGVPAASYISSQGLTINALPLRAVFEVWNQFFRDQNYDTIIPFSKDSNAINSSKVFAFNSGNLKIDRYQPANDKILRVNRFHDLFSSALPAPQKGSPISFGLAGTAPVTLTSDGSVFSLVDKNGGGLVDSSSMFGAVYGDLDQFVTPYLDDIPTHQLAYHGGITGTADLSGVDQITVNQLRLAIASQAIRERDARAGTRMSEQLYAVWSVDAPSLELDRPEFLGGKRIPLNMMEVLQTSETGTTVLGTDAGHSKTLGVEDGFTKSFMEYGIIVSFAYVRTMRSYSQGISKKLFAKERFDLYDPMLDNIGEVDIKQKELMALGLSKAQLDAPIGYQEPWYWLKEGVNHDSGYFQVGITGTLSSWHYGDAYPSGNTVLINAGWLKETPNQVDRTIAVSSGIAYQWSINIGFQCYATRMMNRYNIPNTFGFGSK